MAIIPVSGRSYFNTFEGGETTASIRTSVINQLAKYAAELPTTDASTFSTGIIKVASTNGQTTIAVAGSDYMAPGVNTALDSSVVITLTNNSNGYVAGDGSAKFTNLEVETLNATTNIATPYGVFASTSGTATVIEVKTNSDTCAAIYANGAASFPTITAATVNAANLLVGGEAVGGAMATICFASVKPSANTVYNLWVNTSSQTLSFRTDTTTSTWIPLGAVFK